MRKLLAYATNMPATHILARLLDFPQSSQALALVAVDHGEAGWDIHEIAAGVTEPVLGTISKGLA